MSNIIDRLFSQEVEETKLYSTGNEELDMILTKAYCDGYEEGQREFNKRTNKIINNYLRIKDLDERWNYDLDGHSPAYLKKRRISEAAYRPKGKEKDIHDQNIQNKIAVSRLSDNKFAPYKDYRAHRNPTHEQKLSLSIPKLYDMYRKHGYRAEDSFNLAKSGKAKAVYKEYRKSGEPAIRALRKARLEGKY